MVLYPFAGFDITQADCENYTLTATIYGDLARSGSNQYIHQYTREASATYSESKTFFGTTSRWCTPPSIVFGGLTWRQDDWETFVPGETYTIAATYRTVTGNNVITTHAMSLFSAKPGCGKMGQACCTVNDNYGGATTAGPTGSPYCTGSNSCDSGFCNPCGQEGQETCSGSCFADNLVARGGRCVKCGESGLACCKNPIYPNVPVCSASSHTKCDGNANCTVPAVQSSPPPTPKPVTGTKCNGRQATTSTRPHLVLVQDPYSCGNALSLSADSDQEADACAQAGGWTVVNGNQSLQYYPFCVCSYGGAAVMSVPAYSQDAANTCIVAENMGAFGIWPEAACSDAHIAYCEQQ